MGVLRRAHAAPACLGENDCALFAADAIATMTGVDLAAEWRGTYDDEDSAWAVLEAQGWSDLSALADAHLPRLGEGERVRAGDIVLINGQDVVPDFLAVCLGPDAAGPGLKGLQRCRLSQKIAAWRVG